MRKRSQKTCEYCDRLSIAKGLCSAHYQRAKFNRTMDTPIRRKITDPICSWDGCSLNNEQRGYCRKHYQLIMNRQRKARLVQMLGGKCCRCKREYPLAVYDFHHIDPETKSFELGSKLLNKWESVKAEAAKCQLLCANCHRIIDAEQRAPTGQPAQVLR